MKTNANIDKKREGKSFDSSPIRFDFSNNVELFDYMKGWAIFLVILNHYLPETVESLILFCVWGKMAVPIFLLVTTTLFFRKGVSTNLTFNINKLYKRAIKPYLFLVIIVYILSILFCFETIHSASSLVIHKMGFGPGSYYVPMYVIYSFLLPLTRYFWNSHLGIACLSVIIIIISILAIIFLPDNPYRILPCRYLFLVPLGYIWATKGIELTRLVLLLSFVSLVFLLVFHYSNLNFYPFFWTKRPWDTANWICYFWPAFILPFVFRHLMKLNLLNSNHFIKWLGKRSFELFMAQMTVFYFLSNLQIIRSHIIVYGILAFILSILPIYIYDKRKCI